MDPGTGSGTSFNTQQYYAEYTGRASDRPDRQTRLTIGADYGHSHVAV